MSRYGLKIIKSESPDKTPYTVYYPHTKPDTERVWTQPYYQFISIDPAKKNYAIRIERRYFNGWITTVVFDKVSIECVEITEGVSICKTYDVLTTFLDKYIEHYKDCHFILIERQLPQNYQASRIAQHTISYYSIKLRDKDLLPTIIEVDPKLKGKVLGAPKGITDKQLKSWAVEKATELLTIRNDKFALEVLDFFRKKRDDLSDTVCMIEAICISWGFLTTIQPPQQNEITSSPKLQLLRMEKNNTEVKTKSPSLVSISSDIKKVDEKNKPEGDVKKEHLSSFSISSDVKKEHLSSFSISSDVKKNIVSLVENAPVRKLKVLKHAI